MRIFAKRTRGAALKRKGRALYDDLLAPGQETSFQAIPDDWPALRAQKLAFFHYVAGHTDAAARRGEFPLMIEALVEHGYLRFDPIIYEDFLPVSAAGIFRSNLGEDTRAAYKIGPSRASFEEALGGAVLDEFELYERAEKTSLRMALGQLGIREAAPLEAIDEKGGS